MDPASLGDGEAAVLLSWLAQNAGTVALLRLDGAGRVLEANAGFRGLLQGRPDPVGRPVSDFLRAPGPAGDGLDLRRRPAGVWSLLGAKMLGCSLRGTCRPSGDGLLLVAEVVPPAGAEALEVLSSTSNDLAGLMRDMRSRMQEKSTELQGESLLLRSAESLASIGWWSWDLARNRQVWSDNLFRLYGLEPGSVPPSQGAWAARIHPEDRESVLRAVAGALDRQAGLDLEWRVLWPEGGERWMLTRAHLGEDPHGGGRRYTGIVLDITDRKHLVASLQRSERRMNLAREAAGLGLFVVNLATGTWESCPRMDAILGLDAGFDRSLGTWETLVHPDHRERVRLLLETALESGTRFASEQIVLRAEDGRPRWVAVWADFERDAAGQPVRMVGVAEDVTPQREAEARLRASEETFNRAFQAAPMLMTLTRRRDGTLLEVNERFCEISGYAREECLGRTSVELGWIGAEAREGIIGELQSTGRVRNRELTCRARSGQPVLCLFSAEVVRAGEEDVLVSMAADLTEQRRMEEERRGLEGQLHHLQRLDTVGRLASGVAHDMNNVLSSIMAVGGLLKHSPGNPALVTSNADLLLQAASRARDLVKGLRDFSRRELEAAQELDLNALAAQEVELLGRTTHKRVDLQVDLEPGLPPIFGDPSTISNALMNLALNACDAMPRGGRLTFRTRRLGAGFVMLSVEDDGEGMPPEVLARALEPFYTTKPAGQGTGLGLSQVYGTMRAHGGTLELHSRPGEGTQVLLTFPVWTRAGEAPAEAGAALPPVLRSQRILVVDDEELVRTAVVTLLQVLGHDATASQGGREALQRLQSGEAFDLVILDLNMPGMDGGATLERIRRLLPRQRVLLATGDAGPRLVELLRRFPDLASIPKPFNLTELTRAIQPPA